MINKAQRKGTTFIIIRPDKTVLMQLRDTKSKHFPNMWCFPGGGCEEGEIPLDTIIREASEEYCLMLDRNACLLMLAYQPRYEENYTDHVFICRIDVAQQPVLREGADMKWMTLNEIRQIQIGFDQKKLLPLVEKTLTQFKFSNQH